MEFSDIIHQWFGIDIIKKEIWLFSTLQNDCEVFLWVILNRENII